MTGSVRVCQSVGSRPLMPCKESRPSADCTGRPRPAQVTSSAQRTPCTALSARTASMLRRHPALRPAESSSPWTFSEAVCSQCDESETVRVTLRQADSSELSLSLSVSASVPYTPYLPLCVSLSESLAWSRSRFCVWLETDQAREPATATQLLRCVMTATDTAKSKSPAGGASSLIQSPSAILSQLGSSRHTCRPAELAGLVPARAGREMSASPQPRDTRAVVTSCWRGNG